MAASARSEMPSFVLVQPITLDFKHYIELERHQDDVLATIEVAVNLQAYSSIVLVVQTAGKHDNCRDKPVILFKK